jgi:hypothetical protein
MGMGLGCEGFYARLIGSALRVGFGPGMGGCAVGLGVGSAPCAGPWLDLGCPSSFLNGDGVFRVFLFLKFGVFERNLGIGFEFVEAEGGEGGVI